MSFIYLFVIKLLALLLAKNEAVSVFQAIPN